MSFLTAQPQHILYECGICSALHPWDWAGDCRDDEARYGSVEDYCERTGSSEFLYGQLNIEIRSMTERVEADARGE